MSLTEMMKQAADIRKYAERFGVADRVRVLRADAYRWAERWVPPAAGAVNIFLSPPFPDLAADRIDVFLGLVRRILDAAPDESVLVIQAEEGFPVADVPDPAAWDVRAYGRNLLMFYVVSRVPAPPEG